MNAIMFPPLHTKENRPEDVAGFIKFCPEAKFNELKKGPIGWEKYKEPCGAESGDGLIMPMIGD